jgi:hypothetical protein
MLIPELTVHPLHTSHWFGPSAIGRTLDTAASCAIRSPFSGASAHGCGAQFLVLLKLLNACENMVIRSLQIGALLLFQHFSNDIP